MTISSFLSAPTLDAPLLHAEAARRLRTARPELAVRFDLATAEGLRAAHETVAQGQDAGCDTGGVAGDAPGVPTAGGSDELADVQAVVVLRSLDLASWLRGTCEFGLGLPPTSAAAWRRSFTRTVFLAGNPENLGARFVFDHVASDSSAAWIAPGPASETLALRRLLTVFHGTADLPRLPSGPVVLSAPTTGTGSVPAPLWPAVPHIAHVATAGSSLVDCLVDLNHLLAEAVLDGRVRPGDSLELRRAPVLSGVRGPFTAVRVMPDAADPGRLRARACLT